MVWICLQGCSDLVGLSQWSCGSGIVFGRVGLLVADFGLRRGFLACELGICG